MNRVGIDIDGTLTTMDMVVTIFNRETGKNLTAEDLYEYDVGNVYGISKERTIEIWKNHSHEMFKRHLCIWDIEDFMNKWRYHNTSKSYPNEIVIVTAREEIYREVTESWLRANRINYDEIHFGYHKKIDAVWEHCLDVLVDDKADNIQDIDRNEALDCEGYVVDRPYNRWYGTRNRIKVMGIEDGLLRNV